MAGRRSTAPRVLNERAFPIRVMVRREVGDVLALRVTEAQAWLNDHVGRGQWAMHGMSPLGLHAYGWYFRTMADAERFMAAHPQFELADTTDRLSHLQAARNPVRVDSPGRRDGAHLGVGAKK